LLYPWDRDPVLISQEAECVPGAAWMGAENLTPYWVSVSGLSSLWQVTILTEISWSLLYAKIFMFRFPEIGNVLMKRA